MNNLEERLATLTKHEEAFEEEDIGYSVMHSDWDGHLSV